MAGLAARRLHKGVDIAGVWIAMAGEACGRSKAKLHGRLRRRRLRRVEVLTLNEQLLQGDRAVTSHTGGGQVSTLKGVIGVFVCLQSESGRRKLIGCVTRLASTAVTAICKLAEMCVAMTIVAGRETCDSEIRTSLVATHARGRFVLSLESEAGSIVVELGFVDL